MLADKAIMVSEVACWLASQLLVSPVWDIGVQTLLAPGPEVIKLFFMLSSAETKIYPAHKC